MSKRPQQKNNPGDNSIKITLTDGTEIQYRGGYIGLFGDKVEKTIANNPSDLVPSHYEQNQKQRDGDEHHLTLLFKPEFKSVLKDVNTVFADRVQQLKQKNGENLYTKKMGDVQLLLDVMKEEIDYNWVNLGVGKAVKQGEEAMYQVIQWDSANKFRSALHLERKDFHITLGFKSKDVHDVAKNDTTLVWRP
jgi:hypothetical protein